MKLSFHAGRITEVTDAVAFGRVAVMLGGASSEREISLLSGNAVLAALQRRAVDAHAFDPAERPLAELESGGFDRVWLALHGPGGEDGTMQGALECLGIPYTGSGVLGSAVCMDKLRTKRLVAAVGVATPDSVVLRGPENFAAALERLGLPLIVKPATQGSSVGMTKVTEAAQLNAAWQAAAVHEPVVFAESWVTGAEYTVAILKGRALPSIRIETPQVFYDYEAKYFRSDTLYHCPSGLSAGEERRLGELALAACDACGVTGWGRVDFMAGGDGQMQFLEINTVPGMTDHSLVPMAARAEEVSFDELVWRVLETSFARTPIMRKPA